MKIDPLVISLCEKADKLAEQSAKENDPDKKIKLLEEERKSLWLAVFLQQSGNVLVLAVSLTFVI